MLDDNKLISGTQKNPEKYDQNNIIMKLTWSIDIDEISPTSLMEKLTITVKCLL